MTNSAKQIEGKSSKQQQARASEKGNPVRTNVQVSKLPFYADSTYWTKLFSRSPARIFGLWLLFMGWGFVLHIHRWHFTTAVLLLWFGWLGILGTAYYMWRGGVVVADEGLKDEGISMTESRKRELVQEKSSLLKAIKEIEFDRDLGKLSADDAKEVMRFYRARAIEVIKELDGKDDEELSVEERIERDVNIRLQVLPKPRKAKKLKVSSKGNEDTGKADSEQNKEPLARNSIREGISNKKEERIS